MNSISSDSPIIQKVWSEVQQYFGDPRFTYHSLEHTRQVFEQVIVIGNKVGVTNEELEQLQIAALFHDAGYVSDPENHEDIGADLAKKYLSSQGYPEEGIKIINGLIQSTKMTATATNDLERIIRDADLAHLGGDDFFEISEALKIEKEAVEGLSFDSVEWCQKNLDFVTEHKWNTKAAKKLLNKGKKENIKLLKEKIKVGQKEKEAQIPEKGIETMYRVALRNHNQLSKIADNKANIMLSITAIMLSLIIANLATKIDSNPKLMIPTIIIIVVNLVTMFFAILATRPKVSSAPYSRDAFLKNKINLLFFGNFYKIPLEEFEWGMNQLMENRDLLYGSLSKDLYFLGSVLAKKYKYLQYAYFVFMAGLLISVAAFIYALMM